MSRHAHAVYEADRMLRDIDAALRPPINLDILTHPTQYASGMSCLSFSVSECWRCRRRSEELNGADMCGGCTEYLAEVTDEDPMPPWANDHDDMWPFHLMLGGV